MDHYCHICDGKGYIVRASKIKIVIPNAPKSGEIFEVDLSQIKLPSNTSRFEYRIYDESKTFNYIPKEDKTIPDFRNTLYWNPEIILKNGEEKKIEFYTSDDNSWYELVIKGFTNTGQEVVERKVFKVGNP